MKSRKKTLMTNVAIYASIVLIILGNGLFWKKFVARSRQKIVDTKAEIVSLEGQIKSVRAELSKRQQKKQTYEAETSRREAELAGYGNFLPKLATKPDTIQAIRDLIRDSGITIIRQEDRPLQAPGGGANYYTFDFSMDLVGEYEHIKVMLNRISQRSEIIRIRDFKVAQYDDPLHKMQASINFQTYFSG